MRPPGEPARARVEVGALAREPDDRAELAQGLHPPVAAREPAARRDHVARLQPERLERLGLELAEARLALLAEDHVDGLALARDDHVVGLVEAAPEAAREQPPDGRLPSTHEADENDVVGRHRQHRIRSPPRTASGPARPLVQDVGRAFLVRGAAAKLDRREAAGLVEIARGTVGLKGAQAEAPRAEPLGEIEQPGPDPLPLKGGQDVEVLERVPRESLMATTRPLPSATRTSCSASTTRAIQARTSAAPCAIGGIRGSSSRRLARYTSAIAAASAAVAPRIATARTGAVGGPACAPGRGDTRSRASSSARTGWSSGPPAPPPPRPRGA